MVIMQFVFNFPEGTFQNNKQKTPTQKKEVVEPIFKETYNRNMFLKRYIQSLLKWTYDNNPVFAENLNEDELTKWYINNIIHPEWFRLEMKKNPFETVADMTDYVRQYKDEASTFAVREEFKPRRSVRR